MQLTNSADQYGLVSKILHWLIAALIIALIAIGWWMVDLGYYDPLYHGSLLWHKSLGICVGLIVIFKFVWRWPSPSPQAQTSLTAFERIASHLVHLLLVLAMWVIPASGYLVSSSEGAAIEVFNWFNVPALMTVSDQSRDIAIEIHYYFAYGTLALVALHAAAALKHQFIDGSGTLKRML
jgi:cytochrome b561